MRAVRAVVWLALLVVPALAGCNEDGGGVFGLFSESGGLDGRCGGAYNDDWDHQIILHVRLTRNASQVVDVQDVRITATYEENGQARSYDRERTPDADGCVAFPLRGDGGYLFWGLAFREGSSQCYAMGTVGGSFDGSFEVAKADMRVDRRGSC